MSRWQHKVAITTGSHSKLGVIELDIRISKRDGLHRDAMQIHFFKTRIIL